MGPLLLLLILLAAALLGWAYGSARYLAGMLLLAAVYAAGLELNFDFYSERWEEGGALLGAMPVLFAAGTVIGALLRATFGPSRPPPE